MRLLIVTFDPPENIGGVEGRAVAYTKELIAANHFVDLIALAPAYGFTRVPFYGAKLNKYPSSSRRVVGSFRSAVGEISTNSVDSVFLLSGALTLFGIALLAFARLMRLNSVVFLYGKDILGAKESAFRRFALVTASLLAGRVAVNSRFTAGLLPRSLSPKVGIVYPGVDPSILTRDMPRSADGAKRILFVGRLVDRKGADDLVRAFSSLSQEIGGVSLEIVGAGPEMERLKAMALTLGVDERVRFFGNLTGRALYERYSMADVFAMPSKATSTDVEGFGTVFLEAALFGKPSIGTTTGGIPEAIKDGETGLLVPPQDVEALTKALEELLSDDERRERMGTNAQETALSKFTWKASTASLVGLLGG
ncbi:MAG: glycosyltransferase family 4 protein, partial [Thaumarchaeota archaeon]|nr:glycosyltransferase family 4 protein [Nitrososphaerota archaeon]